MEQDVTVKILRTWIKGLPEEELTLKQIIRIGIYGYQLKAGHFPPFWLYG